MKCSGEYWGLGWTMYQEDDEICIIRRISIWNIEYAKYGIIRVEESKRMRLEGHVAYIQEIWRMHKKHRHKESPRCKGKDNIKMELKKSHRLDSFGLEWRPLLCFCSHGDDFLGSVLTKRLDISQEDLGSMELLQLLLYAVPANFLKQTGKCQRN